MIGDSNTFHNVYSKLKMREPLHHFTLVITIATSFMATTSHASADDGVRIVKDNSTVSIFDGDRPVLRYRYNDVPMKPYVDELFTPDGVQVLLDAPSDHKHHHGLMFALFVEGVNFWEESADNSGQQKNRQLCVGPGNANGAAIVQKLDWVGPDSEEPLLIERRAIRVFSGNPDATLIEWRSCLQTPPSRDTIELSGSSYNGLGIRFVPSMNNGGRFFYGNGKPGAVIGGDQCLTPTKWCAYTARANKKPVTVALFDDPANLSRPATMFTMSQPFAYLSATIDGWKHPITLTTGRPLELRYGVALWDGEVDGPTIERLYAKWLGLD